MTKCRVCGNVHSGGCASFFSGTPSRVTSRVVEETAPSSPPQAKRRVSNTVSNGVANPTVERVRRWRAKGPNRDRYNAQQRERMRARRAAGRAS